MLKSRSISSKFKAKEQKRNVITRHKGHLDILSGNSYNSVLVAVHVFSKDKRQHLPRNPFFTTFTMLYKSSKFGTIAQKLCPIAD